MSIGVHKTVYGRMAFYNGGSDVQMSANEYPANNNWNHLVLTWNGGGDNKVNCYWNGLLTTESIALGA